MVFDASPIIAQLVHVLYYLIPAVIVISFFQSPWFKGKFGEITINAMVKRHLSADQYHLVKNVTLPTADGGTTQIDHIIVSQYGIFVVETKNMKGWIFGNEKQPTWTQKIYRKSHKFQNPLYQNYKHIKTLEQALELPVEIFHSVIVFIGEAVFKTDMPENVTRGKAFVRYIKSRQDVVLTEEQIQTAIQMIESQELTKSFKTDRQHVAHLKQKHRAVTVEASPDSVTCPKCGSSMTLRTVKKGANAGDSFWGCTQYPRCRGMRKTAD